MSFGVDCCSIIIEKIKQVFRDWGNFKKTTQITGNAKKSCDTILLLHNFICFYEEDNQ